MIPSGRLIKLFFADARDLGHALRGVGFYGFDERIEVLCAFLDVFTILPAFFQDDVDEAVDKRDVAP